MCGAPPGAAWHQPSENKTLPDWSTVQPRRDKRACLSCPRSTRHGNLTTSGLNQTTKITTFVHPQHQNYLPNLERTTATAVYFQPNMCHMVTLSEYVSVIVPYVSKLIALKSAKENLNYTSRVCLIYSCATREGIISWTHCLPDQRDIPPQIDPN